MKSLSGKELLRILKMNGWQVIRIKGSHHILGHNDFQDKIVVPVHANSDIKIGLLKQILRTANINENEI